MLLRSAFTDATRSVGVAAGDRVERATGLAPL
jgi:hypothetical protein